MKFNVSAVLSKIVGHFYTIYSSSIKVQAYVMVDNIIRQLYCSFKMYTIEISIVSYAAI